MNIKFAENLIEHVKEIDNKLLKIKRCVLLIYLGERPQLLDGCPKPIENLMTACWDPLPANRPSMENVVKIMTALCELLPGADQPLEYSDEIVSSLSIQ